ncbi:MAG: helix-turn-helix domain-containing protein [Acidimicrobiales bacterium]
MEEVSIGEFAQRSRLSIKALRLYDELGVLSPARVDAASGYRYYDLSQLPDARLIAILRQLDFPLAFIKELLGSDPLVIAQRVQEYWREVEVARIAQRSLAEYLINQLSGKEPTMYEVATREVPERTLLCLKRNVEVPDLWAFGKEFIAILRERHLPTMPGREGGMFSIYWGLVTGDSDGPVEWCKPIPPEDAETLALENPDLTLRVEPAHHEGYVVLSPNPDSENSQWQRAMDAMQAWATAHGINDDDLAIRPEDLGMRITYFSAEPITGTSVPDDYSDMAAPYAYPDSMSH